jgi:hypothetical protein
MIIAGSARRRGSPWASDRKSFRQPQEKVATAFVKPQVGYLRILWNLGAFELVWSVIDWNNGRLFVADDLALETVGRVTVMGCPICETPLYEVTDGDTSRFCCSKGHSFSLEQACPGIQGSLGALFGDALSVLMKR